jgi:hypothetical protein
LQNTHGFEENESTHPSCILSMSTGGIEFDAAVRF